MTDDAAPGVHVKRPRLTLGNSSHGHGIFGEAKMHDRLKAPFPYFGGKSRVADLVWSRLGDVDNFIEPFLGSAAVLLRRPHAPRVETVNDADCMVANFWRATQRDPGAVAAFADGPVNEADLHARHRWLVLSPEAAEFRRRMRSEPDYFDPKVAGWWCWGLCCWIGGGWCNDSWDGTGLVEGRTADGDCEERWPNITYGNGCVVPGDKRPKLSGSSPGSVQNGAGVHAAGPQAKRPKLSGAKGEGQKGNGGECGVNGRVKGLREKQPTLEQSQTGGEGVHGVGGKAFSRGENQMPCNPGSLRRVASPAGDRRPQLADQYDIGRGVNSQGDLGTCAARRAWLVEWFGRLRDRLRLVRVCCGDWLRVCNSDSVTTRLGRTGIFFDPPYALDVGRMHAWVRHLRDGGPVPKKRGRSSNRDGSLYATDGADVDRLVAGVHLYCAGRGADPAYRIALAGYAGEHDALEAAGWSVVAWTAQGGYGNRSDVGKANAKRERLWFSPHTVKDDGGLFAGVSEVPDEA